MPLLIFGRAGTAAPSAPASLAVHAGNAYASLSWPAVAGATSYSVYRGTSPGGESGTAIATGITGTGYVDSGLTNGTTYYYVVKAVGTGGMSAASPEASGTPTAGHRRPMWFPGLARRGRA